MIKPEQELTFYLLHIGCQPGGCRKNVVYVLNSLDELHNTIIQEIGNNPYLTIKYGQYVKLACVKDGVTDKFISLVPYIKFYIRSTPTKYISFGCSATETNYVYSVPFRDHLYKYPWYENLWHVNEPILELKYMIKIKEALSQFLFTDVVGIVEEYYSILYMDIDLSSITPLKCPDWHSLDGIHMNIKWKSDKWEMWQPDMYNERSTDPLALKGVWDTSVHPTCLMYGHNIFE